MTPSIKQRIACEWLILLACIIIGLVIGLTVICSDFYGWLRPPWSRIISEYEVFGTHKQLPAYIFYERRQLWLYVLLLYLAVMLVRSIIWSVNTLRRHEQLSSGSDFKEPFLIAGWQMIRP